MAKKRTKAQIYVELMDELKSRLAVIRGVVDGVAAGPAPHQFAQVELGFLQLRYICEIIALAACVAHEPEKLSGSILKSWHPERTFALLEEINELCFPVSVRPPTSTETGIQFEGVPEALDFATLKKIYKQCGGILHRGNVNRLVKGPGRVYNVNDLDRWAALIGQSLANHNMLIPSDGQMLIVALAAGPNRHVEVFTVQTLDGGPFAVSKKWPQAEVTIVTNGTIGGE